MSSSDGALRALDLAIYWLQEHKRFLVAGNHRYAMMALHDHRGWLERYDRAMEEIGNERERGPAEEGLQPGEPPAA